MSAGRRRPDETPRERGDGLGHGNFNTRAAFIMCQCCWEPKMRVLRAAVAACLLICTGCALPGYESPGFRGQILDRTTMQPIPSAQVSVAPFFERGLTSVTISDPA